MVQTLFLWEYSRFGRDKGTPLVFLVGRKVGGEEMWEIGYMEAEIDV